MKQARYRRAGPAQRRQRGFVSSRQALVLLALLFLMPVFVAWFMHMSAEHGWRPGGTTNKGTLIQPPRPLTLPTGLVSATGESFEKDFLGGKWTLIYLGDAACGQACRERLQHMHQARLAQGENMRRVQRLFLAIGPTEAGGLKAVLAEDPELAVVPLSPEQAAAIGPAFNVDGSTLKGSGNIYLVDPLGNLMMYYRPDADPRGMIQDLERLLKYSHIG